jgi:hypothetical protein
MDYGSDLKEKLIETPSRLYSDLKPSPIEDSEFKSKKKIAASLVVSVNIS